MNRQELKKNNVLPIFGLSDITFLLDVLGTICSTAKDSVIGFQKEIAIRRKEIVS